MKKTISMLLALALCLSLCACGKKKETIEITTENWDEYFTVEQVETWTKNAFDEYDTLKVDLVFSLKSEYTERFVEKQDGTIIVDFSCDGAVKGANIDYQTKTFVIVEDRKIEPYNEIITIATKDFISPHLMTNGELAPASNGDIQYIMVFENPVINRIEGTLTLYEAEPEAES